MSTPSGDSVREEIRENSIVLGNPAKDASKNPLTTANILSVTATGTLDDVVPAPITAGATTDPFLSLSGTPNGNIMTQSFVAAASATTFTSAGFARLTIVSANEAIMSSGAYYVQLGTLT